LSGDCCDGRSAAIFNQRLQDVNSLGDLNIVGYWSPSGDSAVSFDPVDLIAVAAKPRLSVHVVRESAGGRVGVAIGGRIGTDPKRTETLPLLATLPPVFPEWLGDRSFSETHGVRFPYVCGEMANGIATTRMVAAMAEAGMLAFFGAAGLAHSEVAHAIDELTRAIGPGRAWGVNLIHTPQEPALEDRFADLLIRSRMPCVSASAFMQLTPAVICCAVAGLKRDAEGNTVRARRVFAKVSRTEVAEQFMSPPPAETLRELVTRRLISESEAELASQLPIAEDVTVEADSGGHTDNRPLAVLLPAMQSLRTRIAARYNAYPRIRLGAAGGIGTPSAVAAAFALGADYILTGSINQAAIESGLSPDAKLLLGKAEFADVTMAPSADMFELGVKVQVLKRGTMFAPRATRLYDAYLRYGGLAEIPGDVRSRFESEIFHQPLEQAWQDTKAFWAQRDPEQIEKALREPRHLMALTFRWYLGMSTRWAIAGEIPRRADYQIWCGPAMGAFNKWVEGSFLADLPQRSVVQIARNLLEGAAVITRAQQLRTHGVAIPPETFHFAPRPLD
jgi:trans-AT polyketide synthase, acyltransferase and oxidoreductase domains